MLKPDRYAACCLPLGGIHAGHLLRHESCHTHHHGRRVPELPAQRLQPHVTQLHRLLLRNLRGVQSKRLPAVRRLGPVLPRWAADISQFHTCTADLDPDPLYPHSGHDPQAITHQISLLILTPTSNPSAGSALIRRLLQPELHQCRIQRLLCDRRLQQRELLRQQDQRAACFRHGLCLEQRDHDQHHVLQWGLPAAAQ